jgi:hypothetical protein
MKADSGKATFFFPCMATELSVHGDGADDIDRARNIFTAAGAKDISVSQEAAA